MADAKFTRAEKETMMEIWKSQIASRFNPPFYCMRVGIGENKWRVYFNMGAPHIGEGKTELVAWADAARNCVIANLRNNGA